MTGNLEESKYYLGAYRKVERNRILSLDGGGIYGLTEALLLKELCRRDRDFLTSDQPIALFAGCSAGAVNALLLAQYKNPRDAIKRGELEAFWEDARIWTPDPSDWWSAIGLTPQASRRNWMEQLTQIFGDKTLGDLKQNVLISTYAWSGVGSLPGVPSRFTEGDEPTPPSPQTVLLEQWFPWLKGWLPPPPLPKPTRKLWEHYERNKNIWMRYDDPDPLVLKWARANKPEGYRTDSYRHWQPVMFTVFDNRPLGEDLPKDLKNPYRNARIADVAYAAVSPPGLQAIVYGLGDGASFTANPAPHAYSQLMRYLRWNVYNPMDLVPESERDERLYGGSKVRETVMPLVRPLNKDGEESKDGATEKWNNSERLLAKDRLPLCAHSSMAMLSVGDGSAMPYMWPPTANLGSLPFYLKPSNPWTGDFFPPSAFTIQAANEEADDLMREILGWNYFRLNPRVMEMPTAVASMLCNAPAARWWIVQAIRHQVRTSTPQTALDMAAKFMKDKPLRDKAKEDPWKSKKWKENKISLPLPLGPCESDKLPEELREKLIADLDELLKPLEPPRPFGRVEAPGPPGKTDMEEH